MSSNTGADGNTTTTTPLLEAGGQEGNRWWNKVLDLEEAKKQVLFSVPMILTNLFYYLISLVSVMFAGHLGELELAGATLANSWATVTGFGLMVGLSGALETLCGQGFGAKSYRMLGIYLQAASIISILFSIVVSIIWFYTEPILILIQQEPPIAKYAGLYMKYLIPAVFAYGFLNNILRFLQTQSVVMPLIFLSGIPVVLHIGIAYSLVHWTSLGFKGAALAASISFWISVLVLVLYVIFEKKFKQTWQGFSLESFHYVLTDLKLAIPSAAMVCLEYWAFEILVLLAGLMPNAELTTSVIAICVNTQAISYMITYGLAASASTRVSNELGAGNPDKAKKAMAVTLKLSVLLALVVIVALAVGHNVWAGLFSSSQKIKQAFASLTPFLAISIFVDSVQGVLSGGARGCGWQLLAVYVNLGSFYAVGMTVASVLGFKVKLYAKGLWIGLICGLSCQAGLLLLITLRLKWNQLVLSNDGQAEARPLGESI